MKARGGCDAEGGDEGVEGEAEVVAVGVAGHREVGRVAVGGLGGRPEGKGVGVSENEAVGEVEDETGGVNGGEAPGRCEEWRPRESLETLLVLILSSRQPPVLPDTGYGSVPP